MKWLMVCVGHRPFFIVHTILNNTKMNKEQIEEWKKEYDKVFAAECDGKTAYFRKPTRKELSYALSLQSSGKNLEMIEHILSSCFLGGDRCFVEDTDYMLGTADLVNSMIQIKHVEIKNL